MVVLSLAMRVSRSAAGYTIEAPWLEAPVHAATFELAYEQARAARLRP